MAQLTPEFIAAALADGWMEEAFYKIPILKKDHVRLWQTDSTACWGNDGLALANVPEIYPGWQWFLDAHRTCNRCGAKNVKTVRYSFAGRCCEACRPAMAAKYEQKGWCD